MICPDCLENENTEIEMEKVRCWYDTYDHRGRHKEIDLGEYYICPECDNELPVTKEPDEDTYVRPEVEYRDPETVPGLPEDGESPSSASHSGQEVR